MKKILSVIALCSILSLGITSIGYAFDAADSPSLELLAENAPQTEGNSPDDQSAAIETTETFHQQIKDTFIDGGPFFMSFILICLILGLALSIERIIYLNMASINKNKFLEGVEEALSTGGVEAAKDYCRNTRGPIASIFYQGLERYEEGIDMVEKSAGANGGVQRGQLEKGRWW